MTGWVTGVVFGPMNDLWCWDAGGGGRWRWLSGSNGGGAPGNYGIRNVQSSTNTPGARYGHTMEYDSAHGALLLFGGVVTAPQPLNDLWRWDIGAAHWTWLHGSSDPGGAVSVFGIKSVAATDNCPGGRYAHAMTIDPDSGDLYVFGGRQLGNPSMNCHLR